MTSAFYPTSPIKLAAQDLREELPLFSNYGNETDVGETEDEEVKINCMHGVDRDSDLSFADSSDEDRDDDEEDDDESVVEGGETPGVLRFVSGRVHESETGIKIVRPRAERFVGEFPRLPSHQEENESESETSSSRESVGARGIGINLGTPTSKMSTDASPSDGDESSGSDEEDDDENNSVPDMDAYDIDSEHVPEPEVSYPSDEDVTYDDDLSNLPDLLEGERSDEFVSQAMEEKVPGLEDEDADTSEGVIFLIPQQEASPVSPHLGTQYKRPLSSCSFGALFVEDGDSSSKRQKSSELPFMPSLTLGPSALGRNSLQMRQKGSPISTSDDDEEDLDRRLSEELDPEARVPSRENTPVPLLTPPVSPLTIEFQGSTATVCEWPSNLAVDSALTAVSTLRPMSPESLEQLEIDEEQRVGSSYSKGAEPSTLTPLLRSIYVGID